jgi:tetratricopeptide (TPR) repeat protein
MGAASSMIYIFIFSLSDFNLQIPSNAYLFTISASIVWSSFSEDHHTGYPGKTGRNKWFTYTALPTIILLAAALVTAAVRQMSAENIFPVQRTFIRAGKQPRITTKEDAEKALDASALSRKSSKYLALLGQYHLHASANAADGTEREKHLTASRNHYIRALYLNPSNLEILGLLAWTEFSMGNHSKAMRRLDSALEIAPENHFSHLFYAISITNFIDTFPEGTRGSYLRKAREEFEKGLLINPKYNNATAVLVSMGNAFIRLGDDESAVEPFDKITDFTPWALPHIVKGIRIDIEAGRLEKATTRYSRLFRQRYRNDRKSRLMILGFLKEDALSHRDKPQLLKLLSAGYRELGEWEKAIQTLRMELGKGTRPDPDIYYNIGLVYEDMGALNKAREAYSTALSLDKRHRASYNRLLELLKEKP